MILFELFVGEPPFYTNNLVSLIKLIVRQEVKYPENMSPKFKDFLKGLLQKDPNKRLNWPKLLEHPFIQETEEEKLERLQRTEKYRQWIGLDFEQIIQQASMVAPMSSEGKASLKAGQGKPQSDNMMFEVFEFDTADLESGDKVWAEHLSDAEDKSKIVSMRKNNKLLEAILKTLQINIIELNSSQKSLAQFLACLRLIGLLVTQAEDEVASQTDILKNKTVAQSISSKLKGLSKDKAPSEKTCKLISSLVAVTALVSKAAYDPNEGLTEPFSPSSPRSPVMVPVFFSLFETGLAHLSACPSLAVNTLRAFGQLAKQGFRNLELNAGFFKELSDRKVVDYLFAYLFTEDKTSRSASVKSNALNFLASLYHPTFGEFRQFPWGTKPQGLLKDKASAYPPPFAAAINSLLEKQASWVGTVADIFDRCGKEAHTQSSALKVARSDPGVPPVLADQQRERFLSAPEPALPGHHEALPRLLRVRPALLRHPPQPSHDQADRVLALQRVLHHAQTAHLSLRRNLRREHRGRALLSRPDLDPDPPVRRPLPLLQADHLHQEPLRQAARSALSERRAGQASAQENRRLQLRLLLPGPLRPDSLLSVELPGEDRPEQRRHEPVFPADERDRPRRGAAADGLAHRERPVPEPERHAELLHLHVRLCEHEAARRRAVRRRPAIGRRVSPRPARSKDSQPC